jgi:beta-lactamase class A
MVEVANLNAAQSLLLARLTKFLVIAELVDRVCAGRIVWIALEKHSTNECTSK